jgi:hypothetical protein
MRIERNVNGVKHRLGQKEDPVVEELHPDNDEEEGGDEEDTDEEEEYDDDGDDADDGQAHAESKAGNTPPAQTRMDRKIQLLKKKLRGQYGQ